MERSGPTLPPARAAGKMTCRYHPQRARWSFEACDNACVEQPRVESTLADALAAANAAGLVSAYLFGSHAERRTHRESDVDVGVLLDWKTYPNAELTHAARPHPVDVVILNDAPPTFARHILTRGRRIVCRDAEADHAFLRDTLLRAADLEPFLKRMRRLKLAALAR